MDFLGEEFGWRPVSVVDAMDICEDRKWAQNLSTLTERTVGGEFCRRASHFSATAIPSTIVLKHRAMTVSLIYCFGLKYGRSQRQSTDPKAKVGGSQRSESATEPTARDRSPLRSCPRRSNDGGGSWSFGSNNSKRASDVRPGILERTDFVGCRTSSSFAYCSHGSDHDFGDFVKVWLSHHCVWGFWVSLRAIIAVQIIVWVIIIVWKGFWVLLIVCVIDRWQGVKLEPCSWILALSLEVLYMSHIRSKAMS